MILDPDSKAIFAKKYDGFKLFVVNATKDTLYFPASDSRLYMKIQGRDKKGKWQDIEYLPSSWCGNSRHTLYLAPNEMWELATPTYQGEFKTKLRAQLHYTQEEHWENQETIYSNGIDGYVNPGQFWNKREYYPDGLMDPYND